jgi:hypothetical protein
MAASSKRRAPRQTRAVGTTDPETPRLAKASQVDAEPSESPTSPDVRDFIRLAKERFQTTSDAEAATRRVQLEDLKFLEEDQWPSEVRRMRESDNRPCLEIDRLTQPIKQVTNQQRTARPAIQVNPVDDDADLETAEVFQGIIRHIESNSDAEIAYTTAGAYQAKIGRGCWRILTEYVPDSFDQEIKIKRILNPFTVYVDPACQEFDRSDARFAFIIEDVPKEEYRRRFPGSELASLTEFSSIGDTIPGWASPDGPIRIAEYYYFETTAETIHDVVLTAPGQIARPMIVRDADLGKLHEQAQAGGAMVEIRGQRTQDKKRLKWALINAIEVLDGDDDKTGGRDVDGDYIPIVFVVGDEVNVDGKTDYRGIVRKAKDSQRTINYMNSAMVESVGLAPKAPFVIAEGQDEGYEQQWEQANVRNFSSLKYVPVSIDGHLAPAPQRQSVEPPIAAISKTLDTMENGLRATTGYLDQQSREMGPEQSGKAILARQRQSEMGNSDYMDNLGRSVKFTGRILINLIPYVYDAPRTVRIIGMDNQPMKVMVHGAGKPPVVPPPTDPKDPKGVRGIYDLSAGKYDVTISVGTMESKRQEAVESMLELARVQPATAIAFADIMVGNMDFPGAKTVAERLKKMIPAQAQDDESQEQIPPQVQQQMAQMQAELQQLQQLNEQQSQELASDRAKVATDAATAKEKLESAERIAALQSETQVAIANAKIASDHGLATMSGQLELLLHRMEHLSGQIVSARGIEAEMLAPGERPQPPTEPMPEQQAGA